MMHMSIICLVIMMNSGRITYQMLRCVHCISVCRSMMFVSTYPEYYMNVSVMKNRKFYQLTLQFNRFVCLIPKRNLNFKRSVFHCNDNLGEIFCKNIDLIIKSSFSWRKSSNNILWLNVIEI